MARDCMVNKDPNAPPPPPPTQGNTRGFDSEYANLMLELGESPAQALDLPKASWQVTPAGGHDITGGGINVPPWRRPEAWIQPQQPQNNQGAGFRPPGAAGGYEGYGQQWGGYQQGAGAAAGGYGQDYSNYSSYYQSQAQYPQQTN